MIKIVEVGPRDGLQNETVTVPLDAKLAFVDALSDTDVSEIEDTRPGIYLHSVLVST